MRAIYKIVPYEKLTLETSLSQDEVLKRLAANIDPDKSRNWFTGSSSSRYYFEGELYESGFKINRIISYRNSFLPQINGEIKALRFGCTITLKLKLHLFVRIFGIIWFTGVFIACIATLSIIFAAPFSEINFAIFAPTMMFAIGCLAFVGGFKFESIKSRKFLLQLLKATDVEN